MGQELMLKLPVNAQTRKYRRKDRMRWTRADAEVACQGTDAKKYRSEDRMRWTRADAEVACQCTDAKVQERRQDEMDKS
jgi:hypothetical protein